MDRGRDSSCCRSADPEIVESEPEMFDCEACEFRQQTEGLDADNADAWRAYLKLVSHRWVMDMQAGPWWVAQVVARDDDDERDALMARVSVIYDTLHPPKVSKHGA